LQSLICCVLVTFDFDILVECVIFIKCFAWLCEFFAFVKLRYTEPNVPRPFKVPGGIVGAWFITITKVIVISVVFVTGIFEEYRVFFAAIAFNIIVIFWYFIRKWQWKRNEKAYKHLINECNETNDINNNHDNQTSKKIKQIMIMIILIISIIMTTITITTLLISITMLTQTPMITMLTQTPMTTIMNPEIKPA